MSILDLKSFTVGLPCHRWNPSFHLVNSLQKLNIQDSRQVISFCSDLRKNRACIVNSFLADCKESDVLVFVDQDSCPAPGDFENLVINCNLITPFISSNMIYRNGQVNNWFLEDDDLQEKKKEILKDSEKANDIISVRWVGFGMVAIHRTLLKQMVIKYGTIDYLREKLPNLFSEYYLYDEKRIKTYLSHMKNKYFKDFEESFIFPILENAIRNENIESFKKQILPETYSFCERVRKLEKPIMVNLGVRVGHEFLINSYAKYPEKEIDFEGMYKNRYN